MENVYIFDMGGVIKHSFNYKKLHKLLKCTCSFKEFMNIYIELLPLVETGKISENAFFNSIINDTKINMSIKEIKEKYLECTNNVYKDTIEIIKKLKNNNKQVYLFSDLKPIDYNNLKNIYNINNFNKVYLSFNTGYKKTNINAFKYVINDLNIEPNNILFFDDNPQNIENALKLGIRAYLVTGDTILDTFNKYNLF